MCHLLPLSTPDSTMVVNGIEFAVLEPRSGETEWIGHAWVQDERSKAVFGAVEHGTNLENLRNNLSENLGTIAEFCRELMGEPVLVGKGWDPQNPP